MADEWKKKVIQEKLGGKNDWTEEERAELCRQLDQDLDKHIDEMGKTKYEGGWSEDNWKEQMADHPLFAPYVQEEGVTMGEEAPMNPLSEGLAQIKFDPDHNTPEEVAQSYKEEGVLQFKYKKYRLAVLNFSEGLKQKCSDNELNAQLHNNRAAAQWHFGNYRSAIKDCEKAIELKPDYLKAALRAVDCATKLKSWDEVFTWCDLGLKLDPTDQKLKTSRLTAVKEKKLLERNLRKKAQEEKKKLMEEQNLLNIISSRGVKLGSTVVKGSSSLTLADLEPSHPAAQGSRVHINENGELVWPVMLLYPEYHESDIIQKFTESDCIQDHLEDIFGNDAPCAPWDAEQKYRVESLKVFFEYKAKDQLCKIDLNQTLQQVLTDPRYCVLGGTPGFIVLVDGSKFTKDFMSKYNVCT
ncbi:tetratricopeptide repeat protein 4-like [Homarus americanus]|uniref:Tetratricopeptide repeat protein 4-like n=1 Tax=Homarus americanus TaxID=6706 RepID=A0A8J5JBX6_HOMAM|nr:tetratricopeptide repeat protein 4-like [Homarus americanus]XP_042208088.1 tetratricopeptide repeat protein 4-like [Homarus americanus]XP_042208089.1 tetratricopeptide repeat protein 4-like [Homarus americanus]KAG7154203.1 Tetratricopeptide repeat protein 4-like [Homarus americanus]